MTVLYEVECKGCSRQFFVPPGYERVTLCRSCEIFRDYMEDKMKPKSWERPKSHPLWRGVLYAFLFSSPFWVLFYFAVMR